MKYIFMITVLFAVVLSVYSVEDSNKQVVSPLPKQANEEPSILPKGNEPNTNRAFNAKLPKRIWANSYLWAKAPKLEVEEWIGEKPDTKGKYVIIEFWNTWCTHCAKSSAKLNKWHEKYKDELVIIGMTDEPREVVEKFDKWKIDFYSAIDTQQRMHKEIGVWGVPHAIVIEPDGHVIWEGFPLLKGYELTEKKIEKILEIGRKNKIKKAKKAR